MTQKLRPLRDRVVVRREEELKRTAGGIFIPDVAREKQQIGEVVAVGRGHLKDNGTIVPLDIKVGDRVMFGKYSGTEAPRFVFDTGGEELVILREEEIIAVIGEETRSAEKHDKGAAAKKAS